MNSEMGLKEKIISALSINPRRSPAPEFAVEISSANSTPKLDLSGGIPILTMEYEGREFALLAPKCASIAARMIAEYRKRGFEAMQGPPYDLWESKERGIPTLHPIPVYFNKADDRDERVVGVFIQADRTINLYGEIHGW